MHTKPTHSSPARLEACEPRRLLASVSGIVFEDANRNGRLDGKESGIAGRTIFADYDYNGVVNGNEPFAFTSEGGKYNLTTRSSNVSIRIATRTGEAVSLPFGATSLWFSTISGEVSNRHIGLAGTAGAILPMVEGSVFADANANGRLDAGERKLAGRTVFADRNFNGRLDAGESFALTDAAGNYALSTRPGGVSLRLVLNAGETASLPYNAREVWISNLTGTVRGKNFGVR